MAFSNRFSVPFRNLPILLRCVKIINQGTNREKTSNEREGGDSGETTGRSNRKTGREAEASMDPIETYPVKINVSANTRRHRGSAMGNSAISIPPKVPTPLPPLNPAKIVYVCPRTEANPHRI